MVYQLQMYSCMYALGNMSQVGSRQAYLNNLTCTWFTLLCYLLCSGDKI